MSMHPQNMNDVSPEAAAALAESLIAGYSAQGRDIAPLFAAFVGLVFERDQGAGKDCLTVLDRICSASSSA
tara:strand:- start:277 stop:489 length:213 start_codon:yes stop_codon:yes gene_type:complete